MGDYACQRCKFWDDCVPVVDYWDLSVSGTRPPPPGRIYYGAVAPKTIVPKLEIRCDTIGYHRSVAVEGRLVDTSSPYHNHYVQHHKW